MNRFSFRVKIIGTLIIWITVFSLLSFTIFNVLLRNKLIESAENNTEYINLLRDQLYFSGRQHDSIYFRSLLKNLEQDDHVMKTYLVNAESKVVYPDNYSSLKNDTAGFDNLFSQRREISVKTYQTSPNPFTRIFIRLRNGPNCFTCHDPTKKSLGMIVIDLSHHNRLNRYMENIISFSWTFSFFYTVLLLFAIFMLVAYLHYRYIRRSLNEFQSTIVSINQGKLNMRLAIPEAKELGGLGKSFNEMLDTFERTQMELFEYSKKELQNSKKLATIGEMSARIAHEIRNPITGIARAMEIIIADLKEDKNKPILEEIQRQANRVEHAISNLLRYTRTKDISMNEGEINEVIKSLVFFLRHQAHDKPVKFELDLQNDIPNICLDYELIENVLLNLSFNAIKAIGENGVIVYRTRYDPVRNFLIFSVCDNGTGITAEVQNDVFKPFFTTHTNGTGLGLAISKDIIEKHKGEIWFENNKDKGCTFFISLPVIPGLEN